ISLIQGCPRPVFIPVVPLPDRTQKGVVNEDPPLDEIVRGNSFLDQDKYSEAEIEFKMAIEKDGSKPLYYNSLGVAITRQGRYEEAKPLFQKAIGMHPTFWPAYLNYGDSLRATGDVDLAYIQYQKGLEINPLLPLAYTKLIETHFDLELPPQLLINKFQNEMNALLKGPAVAPQRIYFLEHSIISILIMQGKYLDCIDRCTRNIDAFMQMNASVRQRDRFILQHESTYLRYISGISSTANLELEIGFNRYFRGRSLFGIGDFDRAMKDLNAAAESSGQQACLSRIYFDRNDYQNALLCIRKSISLDDAINSQFLYAAYLKTAGFSNEADNVLQNSLSRIEKNPIFHLKGFHTYYENKAIVDEAWGNYDSALAGLNEAISRRPDIGMPYRQVGVILASRGDTVGARDAIATAVKLMPFDKRSIDLA
ncbi:tetratricopeptide repeat protein, partial [bacterium]|nr:tetratricopeptide repeat protein [bacterium]